jgi:hypothetical protein
MNKRRGTATSFIPERGSETMRQVFHHADEIMPCCFLFLFHTVTISTCARRAKYILFNFFSLPYRLSNLDATTKAKKGEKENGACDTLQLEKIQ